MILTSESVDKNRAVLPFKWNLIGSTFDWYHFFHYFTKSDFRTVITLDTFGSERVKIINPVKFQPVSNFGRGGGGGVLPHHENFARKLCKIHWITEQTWLWSGNGIMDAQTPKIIAGWISQWVYVEQYPWPFITSSSGVMDTITVSSSFTSIYSTIPPATKSCQLGKNKC